MAKPKSEKRNPRLVKRGDVILTDLGVDEVVRNVSVIFHLANGSDMVVPVAGTVDVVTEPQLPVEVEEELAATSDS